MVAPVPIFFFSPLSVSRGNQTSGYRWRFVFSIAASISTRCHLARSRCFSFMYRFLFGLRFATAASLFLVPHWVVFRGARIYATPDRDDCSSVTPIFISNFFAAICRRSSEAKEPALWQNMRKGQRPHALWNTCKHTLFFQVAWHYYDLPTVHGHLLLKRLCRCLVWTLCSRAWGSTPAGAIPVWQQEQVPFDCPTANYLNALQMAVWKSPDLEQHSHE